ncbi:uncharacterized protein LOC110812377 [Carica papaya]|uniref:uncharacterized protein LOC110812377 n=1 Tax=Carica papaya TaxID=3649 RepID=UPI000B8C736B|nr:uncharacterized protein LOC110812377 [Carica papaya]
MASMQCQKPAGGACHGHEHSSLGKKVSELVSGLGFKSSHDENKHKESGQQGYTTVGTQCYSKTQYYDNGTTKTQSCYSEKLVAPVPLGGHEKEQKFDGQQHHGVRCHGEKRGERKKKGLFERIKDRISGDSSSSESESDDDHCGEKKN